MNDLIERLHAAIDEDERLASTAARHGDAWETSSLGDPAGGEVIVPVGLVPPEIVDHMVRHDPARVLRTVQVYRDLLAGAETALCAAGENPNDPARATGAAQARHTLEDLADIYGIEVPDHG